MSKVHPRPHFMPVKLRSGYYARNVGPLTLEDAREVSRLAQHAPQLLSALQGLYEIGAPEGLFLTVEEMQDRYKKAREAIAAATNITTENHNG